MASSTNEVKVTLKLFIDKKTNKVVFAESGKEFVDFLFSFLSLPLGTLIRLLSKDQMLGCMGNLYQSVEDLDVTFMQPSTSKNSYLKPTLQQNINEGGFVKGGVNYLVMDDLEVIPLSSISVVTSLKNLNIQQIGSLEEKVVEIGMDEVTKLLTHLFIS
ncbi:hypothetical protein LINPERPRIM_LOCUS13488 [Linum perenne]